VNSIRFHIQVDTDSLHHVSQSHNTTITVISKDNSIHRIVSTIPLIGDNTFTPNDTVTKMKNQWLPASGTLRFASGSLRVTLDNDFVHYYKWLLDRYYCFLSHLPAHGAHISVWLPTKHRPWTKEDQRLVAEYLGKEIKFEYNPEVRVGGFSKPYRNFLIDVRSEQLDHITKLLRIQQNFHITTANTKGGIRPYIMK
jgi:hypothetical protein